MVETGDKQTGPNRGVVPQVSGMGCLAISLGWPGSLLLWMWHCAWLSVGTVWCVTWWLWVCVHSELCPFMCLCHVCVFTVVSPKLVPIAVFLFSWRPSLGF